MRDFSPEEAKNIGDQLGVDWNIIDSEQFRIGLGMELEHGGVDPKTNITNDDAILTAKIALAHLNEFPDYYTRLKHLEAEAEEFWKEGRT